MSSVSSPIARGRMLQQVLPQAGPTYDQVYLNQLVNALNNFMGQSAAPGDVSGARFLCVDPVNVPGDLPDTSTLPTGMLYLTPVVNVEDPPDDTIVQQAWATASLTLTTTAQPIPGASVTLGRDGTFLVMASYDFTVGGNEQGNYLYGGVTGSSHLAFVDTSSKTGRNTVSLQGVLTGGVTGQAVELTAYKGGGGGNSSTGTECSLTVLWIPGIPSGAGRNYFTIVTPLDPQPSVHSPVAHSATKQPRLEAGSWGLSGGVPQE